MIVHPKFKVGEVTFLNYLAESLSWEEIGFLLIENNKGNTRVIGCSSLINGFADVLKKEVLPTEESLGGGVISCFRGTDKMICAITLLSFEADEAEIFEKVSKSKIYSVLADAFSPADVIYRGFE